MQNFEFRPQQRIKRRSRFLDLQAHGRKTYGKHFLILYESVELSKSRLGVTVTKKVDARAVKRNQIKRRVKEFFRYHQHLFKDSFDILVIARNNAQELTSSEIWRELESAFIRAGMLQKQ